MLEASSFRTVYICSDVNRKNEYSLLRSVCVESFSLNAGGWPGSCSDSTDSALHVQDVFSVFDLLHIINNVITFNYFVWCRASIIAISNHR